MRALLFTLLALPGLLPGRPTHAFPGRVDLSWDQCAPIVVDKTTAASETHSLFVSIIAHEEPHRGYNIWGLVGTAARTTPDAWAFDEDGCQGLQLLEIRHTPRAPLSKACPPFDGGAPAVQVKTYDKGQWLFGYAPDIRRFVCANAYTVTQHANPATRYFLMSLEFAHTYSVVGPGEPGSTCGGFENAICFWLMNDKLQYLDAAGHEQSLEPFIGQYFATFNNAANGMGCPAVPVRNRTWGQIKSQYRQ
jgi:hypothetical protein